MTTAEANIPCPHCHTSFSARFDEIGPGKARSCPNCGATIRFAGQDLGEIQQTIAHLTNRAGNASVKVSVKTRIRRPWWKFWSG